MLTILLLRETYAGSTHAKRMADATQHGVIRPNGELIFASALKFLGIVLQVLLTFAHLEL